MTHLITAPDMQHVRTPPPPPAEELVTKMPVRPVVKRTIVSVNLLFYQPCAKELIGEDVLSTLTELTCGLGIVCAQPGY